MYLRCKRISTFAVLGHLILDFVYSENGQNRYFFRNRQIQKKKLHSRSGGQEFLKGYWADLIIVTGRDWVTLLQACQQVARVSETLNSLPVTCKYLYKHIHLLTVDNDRKVARANVNNRWLNLSRSGSNTIYFESFIHDDNSERVGSNFSSCGHEHRIQVLNSSPCSFTSL